MCRERLDLAPGSPHGRSLRMDATDGRRTRATRRRGGGLDAGGGWWMVACDGGQAARGSNIKIHLRGGGGGERSMPRGRRGARVSGFQLILYHGNTMLTVRSKMEGQE